MRNEIAKTRSIKIGNFLSGSSAKMVCLLIMTLNIFFGVALILAVLLYFLGFDGFYYDFAEEIRMGFQLLAAVVWVYGSTKILDRKVFGRVLVIIGLVLYLLMIYPSEIKTINAAQTLSFLSTYLLLFNFLWVLINCLILPQVRNETKDRDTH